MKPFCSHVFPESQARQAKCMPVSMQTHQVKNTLRCEWGTTRTTMPSSGFTWTTMPTFSHKVQRNLLSDLLVGQLPDCCTHLAGEVFSSSIDCCDVHTWPHHILQLGHCLLQQLIPVSQDQSPQFRTLAAAAAAVGGWMSTTILLACASAGSTVAAAAAGTTLQLLLLLLGYPSLLLCQVP